MILKDTNEIFTDDLRDPTYASGYLNITLEDDGIEGFLYALQKVARAHGVSHIAESSDISRESLYRALSEKGNPGIKPLARVLDALGLQITITPTSAGFAVEQATPDSLPQVSAVAAEEVSGLRDLVMEGFTTLREEMRAHQAALGEVERLHAEVQRMTALNEQIVKAIVEQAPERQHTYPDTIYMLQPGKNKKQQGNIAAYLPDPLKSLRTGS